MEITVALAQMEIALDRPDLNAATVRELAEQAAAGGANLLVLPELWTTGYNLIRAGEYAAPLDSGPFALMSALAQMHSMYLVGTALEANPQGDPYNTAALFGPEGQIVGAYQKVHLYPPMGEVDYLAPGRSFPILDLPWGPMALAICYDLRFPELWRRHMQGGAQLVVLSAEWPVPRIEHWRLLLRARAVENQFFVVGCNRAGKDADGTFGGCSAAFDPMGRVLVEAEREPGLFFATLALDEVAEVRRRLPFLDDRRPELYQ